MSDSFDLTPPAFNAEAALSTLKRQLREMRLSERGHAFELRGKRVVELSLQDNAIAARIARKLAMTPEWDRQQVADANAQRKLVDEIRKRLVRWESED